MGHRVHFPGTSFPPVVVDAREPLPHVLDALNSPLLFGCRTGICGTCLCTVDADGPVPPPDADERETLDIFAPDEPKARLACQLKVTADVAIRALGWA